MPIRFLTYRAIDKSKWDACIHQSHNSRVYALSWYLDQVSPNWSGLVLGDYEAVMPLPTYRIKGLPVSVQPYATQQLGVFSIELLPANQIIEFAHRVPRKFWYVSVHFNSDTALPSTLPVAPRPNHVLPLGSGYEQLHKGYRRNTRRNVKKGKDSGLRVQEESLGDTQFIQLYKEELGERISGLKPKHLQGIVRQLQKAVELGVGCYLTARGADGSLQAVGFFMDYGNRIYFHHCASTDQGKQQKAMFLIVDAMIAKQADREGCLLDFTGSSLENIAYFNTGFGAQEEHYHMWINNRIPWPLNKFVQ